MNKTDSKKAPLKLTVNDVKQNQGGIKVKTNLKAGVKFKPEIT